MNNTINYGKYKFKVPNKSKLIDAYLTTGAYTRCIDKSVKYNDGKINYDLLIKVVRMVCKCKYKFMVNNMNNLFEYKMLLNKYELNPDKLSDEQIIRYCSVYDNPIKDENDLDLFLGDIAPVNIDVDYNYLMENKNIAFVHFRCNHIKQVNNNNDIRIYLNLYAENAMDFAYQLIIKAYDKKLLPYFKLSTNYRFDEFIMYVDENEVEKYLDILMEIKAEYPQLSKSAGPVDINLANYDNWIGLGEEVIDELKGIESFSSVREEIADEFLKIVRKEFPNEYKGRNYCVKENHLKGNDPRLIKIFDECLIKRKIDPNLFCLNKESKHKEVKNTKR